jgi:hypothetical protein
MQSRSDISSGFKTSRSHVVKYKIYTQWEICVTWWIHSLWPHRLINTDTNNESFLFVYYWVCKIRRRLSLHPEIYTCPAFIPQSVLRQVRSLFQSEFYTEHDPMLPLSISNILSFTKGHPVADYAFFLRPPITSIPPPIFPSTVCLEGISNARSNQTNQSSFFLSYVGYSSPPWSQYNTCWFITWWVQQSFRIKINETRSYTNTVNSK